MLEELEVLGIVSERLEAAQLPFMLTGSFAMAYYGKPRMTRDLDIVVSLGEDDVGSLVAALSPDFYIDADSVLATLGCCSIRRWTVLTSNAGLPALALPKLSSRSRNE